MLGGGGFTGGVYEIGALRALDLLAVNRTVNQFDVYVGTSAGSFVASLVANGVTPEEMMRVVNQQVPTPFRDVDRGHADAPERARVRPERRAAAAADPRPGPQLPRPDPLGSLIDLAVGLAEALPSGLYDGRGIQEYLETVLGDPDRVNDFRLLENELYLTATDLDTCERIVLGGPEWDDVPISRAVAASTALPMVYKPVEIKGRHLVDGGLRSTTNVDIAVERGAKFVIVVNPLVPYVNDFQKVIPTMLGSRVRRVADMGFPQIGYQAFKLLAHQRLHEAVSHWKEKYPGVDIILIEPDPNDELMFETNILNFTRRVEIARHGFESVTLKLAADYDELKAVCAKHGIEISATRVRKVVQKFAKERERRRPGAASSSRPRARCCGSPRRLGALGPSSAFSSARTADPWPARRARWPHVVVRAERAAGGHDHALACAGGRPAASPSIAARAEPEEVRLARSRPPQVAQRLRAAVRARATRRRGGARSRRRRACSACSTAAWVSAFTPSTGATCRRRSRVRAHRVAGAQARQPVDLREGAHHQQAREGVDQAQARVDVLGVLEVHERLVQQHVHVLGQHRQQAPQPRRRAGSGRSGRWGCRSRARACGR